MSAFFRKVTDTLRASYKIPAHIKYLVQINIYDPPKIYSKGDEVVVTKKNGKKSLVRLEALNWSTYHPSQILWSFTSVKFEIEDIPQIVEPTKEDINYDDLVEAMAKKKTIKIWNEIPYQNSIKQLDINQGIKNMYKKKPRIFNGLLSDTNPPEE